jgi:hypothetical protein
MNDFLHVDCAAAAELALKAHVLITTPELFSDPRDRELMLKQIDEAVDMTESPEDAVCSLVMDLLNYCQREKIDWTNDVVARARERLQEDADAVGILAS